MRKWVVLLFCSLVVLCGCRSDSNVAPQAKQETTTAPAVAAEPLAPPIGETMDSYRITDKTGTERLSGRIALTPENEIRFAVGNEGGANMISQTTATITATALSTQPMRAAASPGEAYMYVKLPKQPQIPLDIQLQVEVAGYEPGETSVTLDKVQRVENDPPDWQ